MEPISIVDLAVTVLAIIFAAVIATVVRAEDDPKTPWDKAHLIAHIKVFLYAIIAVVLAVFLFGYEPQEPKDFLSVLAVAYLGFAFVKAIVSRAVQDNGTATASAEEKKA